MTSKLITINHNNTAAVNQSLPWIPVDANTPKGVKLLLINQRFGVAVIGHYTEVANWTHWQGLPKFIEKEITNDSQEIISES